MLERIAYFILLIVAGAWLGAMIVGMISAWPFGVFGLAALLAIGLLLIKVLKERIGNEEDDYYERTVER